MNLVTILPLAVVMVAGTQLVVAVFLASSDRPRVASLGFLTGAGLVIAAGVTAAWLATRLVGGVAADASAVAGKVDRGPAIDLVVLALLVILAVLIWVRRNRSGPPRWLGSIEHAGPLQALRLGALLFVATPTDDLTMATVGASVARHNLPWWHLVPFVLLTLLLLALPLLALLLLGSRAARVLTRMREWAEGHAWIVNEIVIAFFALLTVLDLIRSG
ncbi:Sap-like sulfolipid-1-addressing protein [Micromonospora violae]|uniref:Sap-like sulfolipid-1-addressing protein n=1 Tax=Micromonospora violae TaxID=1278207 RepID=A0A4Q7UMS4_9ACTN|nr:GAP family protein [Micromonospora violae]RZT81828.1 Sap-like sulfolipid-1-addressing protein [Micromonospora violae]